MDGSRTRIRDLLICALEMIRFKKTFQIHYIKPVLYEQNRLGLNYAIYTSKYSSFLDFN